MESLTRVLAVEGNVFLPASLQAKVCFLWNEHFLELLSYGEFEVQYFFCMIVYDGCS